MRIPLISFWKKLLEGILYVKFEAFVMKRAVCGNSLPVLRETRRPPWGPT